VVPYCRELIDGPTPMHVFDAPTQGAGKGLIIECGCIMSTGAKAEMMSLPANDENEVRKLITAKLNGGAPYIIFDNVEGKFKSPSVASALVAQYVGNRLLGGNDAKGIRNLAIWAATGINIELHRDLSRRSIISRLEPKEEEPYLRTGFKHEPLM